MQQGTIMSYERKPELIEIKSVTPNVKTVDKENQIAEDMLKYFKSQPVVI